MDAFPGTPGHYCPTSRDAADSAGQISADGQAPGPPGPGLASPQSETALDCTLPADRTNPHPAGVPDMHSESAGISHAIPVGITLVRSRALSKLREWHVRTPGQTNPAVAARSPNWSAGPAWILRRVRTQSWKRPT